jgi:hypothetical protein
MATVKVAPILDLGCRTDASGSLFVIDIYQHMEALRLKRAREPIHSRPPGYQEKVPFNQLDKFITSVQNTQQQS